MAREDVEMNSEAATTADSTSIADEKYADIGQATARDGLALVPMKVLKILHLA